MKEKYWFKAYKSGYGWYPHTWQGWVSVLLYVGLLVHAFLQNNFWSRFFIFTAILIIVTYIKGQSITWGSKGKEQNEIP